MSTDRGQPRASPSPSPPPPPPPPHPPPPPPPPNGWPCCDAQKSFIQNLRSRMKAANGVSHIPEFASTYYIVQPPYHRPPSSQLPDPSALWLQKVGMWAPHLLRHRIMPPCPVNESHKVSPKDWAPVPRLVFDLHHHWLLDSYVYSCEDCSKTFRGTSPDSIKKMPLDVQVGWLLLSMA